MGRKRYRLALELARYRAEIEFLAYGQPLTNIKDFKYLGRLLSANNYNWKIMVTNIKKSRKKCTRV